MSETVTALDGTALPIDSLPATLTFSGGFIQTIVVHYSGISGTTYTQTFTNNGTNVTAISGWVAS